MARKTTSFKTKGMNRDMSVSSFNPDFSFENRNLRLSTNEGNTMMSWVNEKGTFYLETYIEGTDTQDTINGVPIGTAVLNHYLVVFTTVRDTHFTDENGEELTYEWPDYIYRLKYRNEAKTELEYTLLYQGDLGFSLNHPIETLVSYEAETIQKVYWTDNKNQPRFINIVKKGGYGTGEADSNYNPFDFAPEVELRDEMTVLKMLGVTGRFAAGVIQYAFTYYNQNGQESAIVNVSPLLYISYQDRGAAPDAMVENAFRITIDNVDTHFEYVRLYSIQRTSLDDTPIVKRLQDVKIDSSIKKVTYIDTGYNGDTITPTELLYKGSEILSAKTLEQKDGTLFFGNLKTAKQNIHDFKTLIQGNFHVYSSSRTLYFNSSSNNTYSYGNQLTAFQDSNKTWSVPCGYFKVGDYYRLGIQFQYKTGKWSEPVLLANQDTENATDFAKSGIYAPSATTTSAAGETIKLFNTDNIDSGQLTVPGFQVTIDDEVVDALMTAGYKRARAVVVFPEIQDRVTICQGVICPTLKKTDFNYYQSSWFFRTYQASGIDLVNSDCSVAPAGYDHIPYIEDFYWNNTTGYSPYIKLDDSITVNLNNQYSYTGSKLYTYNPNADYNITANEGNIRQVEIQGSYSEHFDIDWNLCTFHSPDIEFDDWAAVSDFTDVSAYNVGNAIVARTLSDIDIQTSSPTISNNGSGFVHKSFIEDGMYGIVSGLFYEDYVVDDADDALKKYTKEKSPVKWMVYLWNKGGSLNNDINRPSDKGTASAVLKKKVISNLRYATTVYSDKSSIALYDVLQLFSSDEPTLLKMNYKFGGDTYTTIYQGNIDTVILPDYVDGQYFAVKDESDAFYSDGSGPSFTEKILWKTFNQSDDDTDGQGLWYHIEGIGTDISGVPNDIWCRVDSNIGKDYLDLVIKKESVRMKYKSTPHLILYSKNSLYGAVNQIPIVELQRTVDVSTLFGGNSEDAIMANTWIPCGEAELLEEGSGVTVSYDYGDTYFQRWDCLKTYPYTTDDVNQMVEIGSFMLETKINIDGRYDRNRGQLSNLNMSPKNFNLYNPVYSQRNNFFNYKILDESSYADTEFPNQITWSLTKENGADVDTWTNITLASILELDGDKGKLNKLTRFNDQLLAFQDTGISQILYNENVQINSTDGVPIEIANSGKVQGKRYLSNTIGCSNKYSLVTAPSGVYFMDNTDRGIYLFNGELQNISITGGFNSWCKQNIKSVENSTKWTPVDFKNFTAFYDKVNQDILFIDKQLAFAYSERFGTFTSFYDYGNTPYYVNMDSTGIWIRDGKFYKHNAGNYCYFFDDYKPYWMTLIANPEPQTSKVFTNLELRANVDSEGTYDESKDTLTPLLPFDSIETWDEYQHGITSLANRTGSYAMQHHTDDDMSSLKRKFRIWRSDLPRDNYPIMSTHELGGSSDSALGISRTKVRKLDRMRNPWLYLKLMKKTDEGMQRTELHDLTLVYFS